jgi:hypothetical protein
MIEYSIEKVDLMLSGQQAGVELACADVGLHRWIVVV